MAIQISISDVRESLQVFANGNTANNFTVTKGAKALAQKDADVLANKIFKLGTFDLPNYGGSAEFAPLFHAFFADNNIIDVISFAKFTIVLEIYNCSYSVEYSFARIHVYCTVPATTLVLMREAVQEQATQEEVEFATVAEVLATYPDFSIFGEQKFVPKGDFPVTAENFQQYRSYCEFAQDYFFNLWQDFDAASSRDVREVKAGKSINTTIVSTHRGDITLVDYIADCQKLWAQHQATFVQLANEYHKAKQAEEVAQIQEAAELEEAILENETPVFVGLEFSETETPELDTFIINKRGYAYLNGKYKYQWGSYEYVLGTLRGSDVCVQGFVIAEHIETVEEAYEIAKKHYQNWAANQPKPTRTETLAKEIFNDTLAQNPLIQQDFGQSAHVQIIDVCADSTFEGLGISAQSACALPQPQAETAPAETVGNPETPKTDPYLAERPIDETITAKEFYSYADPETLTDSEIIALFEYNASIAEDTGFWDISIGKTLYRLVSCHNSGEYSLYTRSAGVSKWNVLIRTHAQIIREAYTLIYKDLCQISPFAPRETIINLEADKGLSDMQVREVEKSLLIGINTAENFIIYNARAEYDIKAGRWLCVGKDHKTGKRLEGYIDACKIVQPYKQTL